MNLSELKKDDYLGLVWHFVLLAVCVVAVGGAFYLVYTLDTQANYQLNIARGEMSNAQAALDQIEQEEATIGVNLAPYRRLAADGVIAAPDRLDMQENFARIQAEHALLPIQLDISAQASFMLPYPAEIARPGGPVNLLINKIDASLPLLHEGDLSNFLAALLDAPSLIVPTHCTLATRTRDSSAYLRLGQHQYADCSFVWYNFQVQPAQGATP